MNQSITGICISFLILAILFNFPLLKFQVKLLLQDFAVKFFGSHAMVSNQRFHLNRFN